MTNYSKTTNFTAKDSLVSGDANKIVKGSEIDAEFDNIATASATKANIASPVFTGVVSFPDGSAGDPSITNTGDTNTGLFFSAADTLSFTAAGTAQFTMGDGVIAPVTDADVDLGTSSLEFKDAYFDGTVHTDAINLNGTAITSTAAELNILDGVTSTAAELNILDGVTATAAELNILDGVTSTAAELNILDGKAFLDEDDMSSNSATGIASQQSIKAYVDAQITAEDLDFQADSGGALSIDLDSETLTFTGGTGVDTSGSGNAVTFAIDSTVATLTGSQTLTNKSLTAPTLTGTAVVASLDISGDIDVDGTTNLDVVDIDGALTQDGGAVFNEAGADVDFRVESDANTHALFVEGSSSNVGIGASSPGAKLEVNGGGTATTGGTLVVRQDGDTNSDGIALTSSNATSHRFWKDSDGKLNIGPSNLPSALVQDLSGNVIIGSTGGTLQTATAGTSNFRAGVNAGNSITSGGNYNVVVGDEAGTAITTGDNNVALGFEALKTEDTSGSATAIGYQALRLQNSGGSNSHNSAVGAGAGTSITTGNQNTIFGSQAADALTDADFNVAVGYAALGTDTLGSKSTAIGYGALDAQNFTTATDSVNVAVGHNAGGAVTTGVQNTLIGANAGDSLTDADHNVAVGRQALTADTLGSRSVAIGRSALEAQNFTTATDSYNVAVGFNAGTAVTTGIQNTLLGGLAGDALTSGTRNVALGMSALSSETSSSRSVAIGNSTLETQNVGGSGSAYNTAIGSQAGNQVTTGVQNTIVGGLAGDAMTSGDSNVFIGYNSAGSGNVTGDANTAVGESSGQNLTTGSNNLFLGKNAGRTGNPGGNITTQSNEIVFGDGNITEAHIQVALTVASDERDKTDFVDLDLGLNFVKALEPVTYYWDKRSKYGDKSAEDYDLNAQTPDGTHKEDWMDIGFKAQSVQALEEAAGYKIADKKNLTVSLSGDGKQYGLRYEKFIPILVKAIKDQDAIITALTARIEALES